MLYRALFICTSFLAFAAFAPSSVAAQTPDGGCYQCDEATEECNEIPDEYVDYGCLADGGIMVCEGGVCSDECQEDPGSCKIIMTLAPFGITIEDRIIFQKGDMEFASVLPVPGKPGFYADWSCEGELRALYQRTALGFFEEVPADPFFLMVSQ